METVTALAIWIGLALLCMYMAEQRGRDKALGLIAGLFLGVFAVAYYLIVGDSQQLKDEKLEEQIKRVDALRTKK